MVSALPKDARTGRTVEPCLRVVLDGLTLGFHDLPIDAGSVNCP
jgi:hypothetical protein